MQIKVSYKKALEKLHANNLFDGFMFVMAEKSYFLWGKTYIFTTNNEELVITPFLNKNNPKVEKIEKIKKSEIASFDHSSLFSRKFKIILKNGTMLSYVTSDLEIGKRVELLNKWLNL